jgi:hypothetical protein
MIDLDLAGLLAGLVACVVLSLERISIRCAMVLTIQPIWSVWASVEASYLPIRLN